MQNDKIEPCVYCENGRSSKTKGSYSYIRIYYLVAGIDDHICIFIRYFTATPVDFVFPYIISGSGPAVFKFCNELITINTVCYAAIAKSVSRGRKLVDH